MHAERWAFVRARRNRRSAVNPTALGAGTPVYELLPAADLEKLIDATFQLMRETGFGFDPDPLSSGNLPDANLFQRIDDDLREILANHRPEPMSESLRKQLAAIQDQFAAA